MHLIIYMDIWLKQSFHGKIAAVLNICIPQQKYISSLLVINVDEKLKINSGKMHLRLSKILIIFTFICMQLVITHSIHFQHKIARTFRTSCQCTWMQLSFHVYVS